MSTTLSYRFACRRRTSTEWASLNEVLLKAEIGLETDTGRFKFGDGTSDWNSLDYAAPIQSSADLPNLAKGVIGCTFDGGGAAITVGSQCDVLVPFDCTIVKATVLADQTGSIQVDVWMDSYANFPPTVADKITASAPPAIGSGTKSVDTTLTGWTTTVTAGSLIRFNVDSVTTIERATIILEVIKS